MDMNQISGAAPSLGSVALKRLDDDASGGLTRKEVAGQPQFEAAFRRADTDNNRSLDAAEIDAQVETHRRRDARPESMNQAIFAAVLDGRRDGSGRATRA
ncbi:hypothetical protein [Frigidibacter sp.]|uniref:hypothetical protein n=1 Tax=Frigidibacter sp. TaxID=2586418 RepID=UPI0027369581|nr:hypothetical protein [Frigidibacter sp.]MDP3338849.1 hypothetical protein [Frigidibacter sp.]